MSYLRPRLGWLVAVEEHALAEDGSPGSLDQFLTTPLNQIIAVPRHIVLVLDDYRLITADTVHYAEGILLDPVPTRMHIAIATRVGLLIS